MSVLQDSGHRKKGEQERKNGRTFMSVSMWDLTLSMVASLALLSLRSASFSLSSSLRFRSSLVGGER